jgi:hypothetical protein
VAELPTSNAGSPQTGRETAATSTDGKCVIMGNRKPTAPDNATAWQTVSGAPPAIEDLSGRPGVDDRAHVTHRAPQGAPTGLGPTGQGPLQHRVPRVVSGETRMPREAEVHAAARAAYLRELDEAAEPHARRLNERFGGVMSMQRRDGQAHEEHRRAAARRGLGCDRRS